MLLLSHKTMNTGLTFP